MSNVSSINNLGKRVPKLRFPGFEGEWKESTLGEIGTFTKGAPLSKADISSQGTPFILYGELYTTYDEVIENIVRRTEKSASSEQISRIGDVIIPTSGETPEEIATASCVMLPGVILAGDLNIFRTNTVDGRLISYIIRHIINKKISCVAQGKSVVHVKADELSKISVRYPGSVEQHKLLSFLALLQSRIAVQRRFVENLKLYKRGVLSKLFPKKGTSVPECRFVGFTDDWEQRKLGEIADIVGGGTPSTSNDNYWDGDIDWYAPAEIAEQIYVSSSERKITQQGFDNSSAKMLPAGTVLFTSRAGIGKTAILRKKGCTNQGFQSIVPHENALDSYFIFSRSEELKRYGETVGAGSTFVEVSGKQMASMELMMPTTMEEQQQIGEFFSRLDTLITLHQRKLDELESAKKSLLQKMFI